MKIFLLSVALMADHLFLVSVTSRTIVQALLQYKIYGRRDSVKTVNNTKYTGMEIGLIHSVQ